MISIAPFLLYTQDAYTRRALLKGFLMIVYLLQDVEKLGLKHEMIKVSDGYARNFLFPHALALEITPQNRSQYEKRAIEVKDRKKIIESKTSMLAERIGSLELILKRKMHDDGQLYGSVGPGEIADLLAAQGVKVAKNQVLFDKSIKERGKYKVTIKLSSQLQPSCAVNVVSET